MKCSGAYTDSKFSYFMLRWRRSDVALVFQEWFQDELGFCQGTLCTLLSVSPPHSTQKTFLTSCHTLPVCPPSVIFNAFHRYIPLYLRNCASFQISPPNVLFFFSALTFNSEPHLYPCKKVEQQHVAKTLFIFNLAIFIHVLILWPRHGRFMPPIQLKFG